MQVGVQSRKQGWQGGGGSRPQLILSKQNPRTWRVSHGEHRACRPCTSAAKHQPFSHDLDVPVSWGSLPGPYLHSIALHRQRPRDQLGSVASLPGLNTTYPSSSPPLFGYSFPSRHAPVVGQQSRERASEERKTFLQAAFNLWFAPNRLRKQSIRTSCGASLSPLPTWHGYHPWYPARHNTSSRRPISPTSANQCATTLCIEPRPLAVKATPAHELGSRISDAPHR